MHSSAFQFPMIVTHRITMRLLEIDDAPALLRHFADPDVTEFMDINALTNEQEAADIIRFHEQNSGCRWGLFLSENWQLIGTCGFHCWTPGVKAEIGFDLAKQFWGQAYMREALMPVIDFAFDRMQLNYIEADVEPANQPSIALLKRLGFKPAARPTAQPHNTSEGSSASDSAAQKLLYFRLHEADWAQVPRDESHDHKH